MNGQDRPIMGFIHKEIELYRKWKGLVSRQREAIVGKDPEHLNRVLEEKERIISKILSIEGEIAPIRDTFRSRKRVLSEEIPSALKRLTDLMAELASLEKESVRMLAQSVQDLKGQMRTRARGTRALQGYRPALGRSSRFVDRRG